MRIIAESRLDEFGEEYPDAASWLETFSDSLKVARWKNLQDVRASFPHADAVQVESGKTVTVFNAKGSHYRLVLALHYNTGVAYVLRFMPHKEYSRDLWKKTL
ncbi:MAG TPA: type II toxin-antitoxin system HigB family toxin [Tepidisphaeraceae bacterium]|jgi:mRNA interferase HigB